MAKARGQNNRATPKSRTGTFHLTRREGAASPLPVFPHSWRRAAPGPRRMESVATLRRRLRRGPGQNKARASRARRSQEQAIPLWAHLGIPAATLLLALAVRWLYIDSIRSAPFFENLQTNSQRYHQWALLLLDGNQAPTPPFDQSPGYAYFLALLYRLCGQSVLSVATVQAGIDAFTCALIAHVAGVWFGWRAAIAAALLAALCAPMIYFSAELLPASLSLALLVSTVAASVHRRWLAVGSLWALALCVRSESILAVSLVCLDAVRRSGKAAALRALLPPLAMLLLFTATNAWYSGHFVPLTIGSGLNLWLGNNPEADGVSPFLSQNQQAEAAAIQRQAGGDAVVADRLFLQQALAFWRDQPMRAAGLLLKKVVWTCTHRELPNTSDIDWQTAQSWLFSAPFLLVGFGVLLPLALAGYLQVRQHGHNLLPATTLLALGGATCILFFTNARFRLPMLPPLLWFAAAWLAELAKTRHARIAPASVFGLAVGLLLAWGNFYSVRDYSIAQITVNTGIIEREAGHLPAATQHLRRGLARNPSDAIAWVHLALALEQMGLVADAVDTYIKGLQQAPASIDLQSMARRCFARQHLPEQLLEDFLNSRGSEREQAAITAVQQAVLRSDRSLPDER